MKSFTFQKLDEKILKKEISKKLMIRCQEKY